MSETQALCSSGDVVDIQKTTADGAVLVLARVKKEYIQEIRNHLIKVQHIIPNYGGNIIGLANTVNVLARGVSRDIWSENMSMMVLQFPSLELAVRWSQSDPAFRDRDFPCPAHRIEMIAVPLRHIPPPGFKTFQVTFFIVHPQNAKTFHKKYIDAAAIFYSKHKICFGVALTDEVADMRPGWINLKSKEYVTIHMFPNQEILNELYTNDEYEELKAVANCLSVHTTIAFTIK